MPRSQLYSVRRRYVTILSVLVAVCCLVPALRLPQAQQRRIGEAGSSDPSAIESGSKLFSGYCSVCHGIDGKGGARGPDLTQGLVVNRGTDDEVAQVIRKGVQGSSMPAFDLPVTQVQHLVAFIRSLSVKAAQLSVSGDVEAGRKVFFGKGRCFECHMVRGAGGLLGPELSNLGSERTLQEIRQSILQPGTAPDGKYRPVTVVTSGGDKVVGVLRNRDNFSLQMIDQKGRLRFFLDRELHKIETNQKSLMPENYGVLLTPEELQNLLAYLSRQTVVASGK